MHTKTIMTKQYFKHILFFFNNRDIMTNSNVTYLCMYVYKRTIGILKL